MSRRAWLAALLAGLLVHALLLAGALEALPVPARVVLAAAALVLAPGFGLLALLGGPPGGARFAPGWALGFGVAWLGLQVLVTVALRLPFTVLEPGALATGAALALVLLARRRARGAGPEAAGTPPVRHGAVATLALLGALALGTWSAARYGPPLSFFSDSPDHVATVRRMAQTGVAFPEDAFFKDAGRSGLDPRKSLWHPEVALVTRLARADALETWRWLPLLLVPLFVLTAASLGFLLRGPPGAAIAAWALVLTYGGSFAEQYLREAVFATKLGDQLALATAVAVLADLARRTRASRAAAVVLAFGAIAAHVYYVIPFAFGFGGLAVACAVQDRGLAPRARRLAVTTAALLLACLPYLAWRAGQAYAPRNPIHTAPQGLLTLWDHVQVMNVGILWDWYGLAWVLLPLALPALWRAGRASTAALQLAVSIIVVFTCLFFPPVTGLLQPRLGYLLLRMTWMVPLSGVLAWLVPGLVARLARGSLGAGARVAAAAGLAVVAIALVPALREAGEVLAHPERLAREEWERSAAPWWDALTWMRHALPPGAVVLSDPITAYTIPMATGHFVTTLLDQHSSPNDEHALDRLYDARDGLDPFSSWARTRAVVQRYGVTDIVLNDRFRWRPALGYWGPGHAWFAAARARFDRAPAVFVPRYDTGDLVVYEVRPAALDTLAVPVAPPASVHAWDPAADPEGRRMGGGMPLLLSVSFAPHIVVPGDTVDGVLRWRAPAPLARGSYLVSVRFDRPLPGGFTAPRWCAKPVRKLIERIHHERFRFRDDHLPAGGDHGLDLWRPDQVIADSFAVVIPPDVADGTWTVSVRIQAQAPYPNYRLSDYFMDEDYYAGVPVDTVRIRRGTGATAGG